MRNLARLIYPHFRFGETKIEEAIKLVKLGVGGFCLYGGKKDEVIETIRILRSNAIQPLLFSADYENGTGQWVDGGTKLPSNMAIAASNDIGIARRKAEITAIESDALGVDWVFAPVVDIANNHSNPIVNIRAFSDSIEKIVSFAASYIQGLKSFNVLNSLKHFPGHGDSSVDSHLTLPEINKPAPEIENFEIIPFKSLLEVSDSVMVGHLMMRDLDSNNPASFSRKIITTILRNRFNYNNVIITDALMMKAIKDEIDCGIKAFLAGADILLYPEDPYRLYYALIDAKTKGVINERMVESALSRQDVLISKRRISNYKTKDISVIGCKEHRDFVLEIAHKCISWVKRIQTPLPLKVFYMETLKDGEYKGIKFIEELKKIGFELKSDLNDAEIVIIASFSKPKAFSGNINLNLKEKEEIDEVLKSQKKVLFISFGSPFVFDGYINKIDGGIACFSDIEEFQIICARGLKAMVEFKGVMPVKIHD